MLEQSCFCGWPGLYPQHVLFSLLRSFNAEPETGSTAVCSCEWISTHRAGGKWRRNRFESNVGNRISCFDESRIAPGAMDQAYEQPRAHEWRRASDECGWNRLYKALFHR